MRGLTLPIGVPVAHAQRLLANADLPFLQPATSQAVEATSLPWSGTATASATPHTAGSWVELVAATSADVYGLIVGISAGMLVSGTATSGLLDIGVGAAASEVVVVPNLNVGYSTGTGHPFMHVPVFIPRGSRVAMRLRALITVDTVGIRVVPVGSTGTRRPSSSILALGANEAASQGVALTAPGSINTKGAWTEITAATTEPFRALMLAVGGNGDTDIPNANVLIDIGVGAAGSEVVVVGNLYVNQASSEVNQVISTGPWEVNVPAGSRVACRYQGSSLLGLLDAIVYGIR